MSKKFKLFSKLKTNLIDHPKIKHNRLKKRKWLRLKNTVPQRLSEYGSLLMSKQMLRAFYGNCSEKEFISTYKKAKTLKGNTGVNFIKLLEHRLDTVLLRMRFANTFEEIRQFITHKHILVNNKIVHTSSFTLKTGDKITIRKESFEFISKRVLYNLEQYLNIENQKINDNILNITNNYQLLFSPDYIEVNYNTLEGIFIKSPILDEIQYPFNIDLPKIIQYYEYKKKL